MAVPLDRTLSSSVFLHDFDIELGQINKKLEQLEHSIRITKEIQFEPSYIHCIKIMYDFARILFISPVHLVYSHEKNMYAVRQCSKIQRMGCLLVLLFSCISAAQMLRGMGQTLLAHTGYIVSYFDFMNGVFLHVYMYSLVYLHWFRSDILENFVFVLQKSPVVLFCTWSKWKAKALPIFFWCLTLYMAFIWLIIVYEFQLPKVQNINWFFESNVSVISIDFSDMIESSKRMARQIFYIDKKSSEDNSDDDVDIGWCIVALIARFYNGFLIHLPHNVFGPCFMFTVHFITTDFLNTVTNLSQFSPNQVMVLYRDLIQFLKHANVLQSIFCIHFVGMTLTYHSVHLFDALATRGHWLWRLNTYLYIVYLFNFLVLPTKTWLMGKTMKRWICKNGNWSQITKQEISLLLYDCTTGQVSFKGGKLFVITARFSGVVFQLLCSYSMMNTVARQFYHHNK